MSETVLIMAGLPVGPAEWRIFLQRSRAAAVSSVMKRGGDPYGPEGEEELVRRALAELEPVKKAEVLMLRLGILADAGFEAFMQAWTCENERRKAALERGEPVYGPKQYRPEDYYFHLHRLRLNELKEKLRALEPVTEERLQDWYLRERDRNPALRRPDRLTAEVYRAPAGLMITEVNEPLMNSAPERIVTFERPDKGGAWSVYELLAPLSAGERSAVVIREDGCLQYRLVKREPGAFYSLEEDREWIEHCYYEQLLTERIRKIPAAPELFLSAGTEARQYLLPPLPEGQGTVPDPGAETGKERSV